jgi:hypothetical protein
MVAMHGAVSLANRPPRPHAEHRQLGARANGTAGSLLLRMAIAMWVLDKGLVATGAAEAERPAFVLFAGDRALGRMSGSAYLGRYRGATRSHTDSNLRVGRTPMTLAWVRRVRERRCGAHARNAASTATTTLWSNVDGPAASAITPRAPSHDLDICAAPEPPD